MNGYRGVRTFAVGLMVVAAIMGCGKRRSSTTVVERAGSDAFLDNFPGSTADAHKVSDDQASLNDSGAKVNRGLQTYWNRANGTAIVLYLDETDNLRAHYFNGTSFTPSVVLKGANEATRPNKDFTDGDFGADTDSDNEMGFIDDFQVVFLNTGALSDNVRARNGDAIILWSGMDLDAPSTVQPNADANRRAYATYFDVSASGTSIDGTDPNIRFGFQTRGTAVDFDNQSSGDDDSVTTIGFASDSLVGSHQFQSRASTGDTELRNLDSGDPTSFVYMVWRKAENSTTTSTAERIHALEFDLAKVGNAMPTEASSGGATVPGSGSLTSPVASTFVVHNGGVIWQGTDGAGTFNYLTRLVAGGATNATVQLDGTSSPSLPSKRDVYGADHGLTSLYAFYVDGSGDLRVAKSDLDSTLADEGAVIDDPAGTSDSTLVGTRINRGSDWIMALFRQQPATGASTTQVMANAVQTRKSGTARSLAASVATAARAPNQRSDATPELERLQSELADGTRSALDAFQTNLNRMNFTFQQDDATVSGVTNLIHNGVVVTLGLGTPTAAFAITAPLPEGRVDQMNEEFGYPEVTDPSPTNGDGDMRAVATDLGTADGSPLIYYIRNANTAVTTSAATGFAELRVFGFAATGTATPVIVSTDGAGQRNVINAAIANGDDFDDNGADDFEAGIDGQFLRIQSTPRSTAAGAHTGSTVHLFMLEARGEHDTRPHLVTRSYAKSAAAPSASTFASAHEPDIGTAPTIIDGETTEVEGTYLPPTVMVDGDEIGPRTAFITTSGNSLGVYFQVDRHYLYQEFDGGSWLFSNGVSDPQLVDNEANQGMLFPGRDQRGYTFGKKSLGTFDDMGGALVFYSKMLPGERDPGARRWFARVHD